MLSQRAQKYLAQLHRDEPLPVAKVEQILIAQGYPAYPAWLAFHDQFAGYHESIGSGNLAVWGLAFAKPRKSGGDAYKVYVTMHKGAPAFINCADVHASFDYMLMPDGEYNGPPFPSENFSIKVERNALLWEFSSAGPIQRLYDVDGVQLVDIRQQLLDELRPYLVPEASDKFANYYASPTKVLLESLENTTLKLLVRKS